MAITYKKAQLQGTGSLTSYGTLYNVPSATSAVISTIAICNTSSASYTFRIGIMGSAGTPAAANWLVYDVLISGNDTIYITNGIVMVAGDYMRVSSSSDSITFSLYVAEMT